MILNGINFGVTFIGLYLVEHYGRRKSLIGGSIWMFVCFMIFASVGHFALDQEDPSRTQSASTAMICFACFFILGFATTWGPMVSHSRMASSETTVLTNNPGLGHHWRALSLPLSCKEYGIGDRIELAVSIPFFHLCLMVLDPFRARLVQAFANIAQMELPHCFLHSIHHQSY
jgi:hypothetical protein